MKRAEDQSSSTFFHLSIRVVSLSANYSITRKALWTSVLPIVFAAHQLWAFLLYTSERLVTFTDEREQWVYSYKCMAPLVSTYYMLSGVIDCSQSLVLDVIRSYRLFSKLRYTWLLCQSETVLFVMRGSWPVESTTVV